jgi:uncharacterized membrane protein YciS (DUF1049 family)
MGINLTAIGTASTKKDRIKFRQSHKQLSVYGNLRLWMIVSVTLSVGVFPMLVILPVISSGDIIIGLMAAMIFYLPFVAFGLIPAIMYWKQKRRLTERSVRLWRFAQQNNTDYTTVIPLGLDGSAFQVGFMKQRRNVVSADGDNGFEIGDYFFKTSQKEGEGLSKSIGYMKISLGRKLPNMILDAHSNDGRVFGLRVSDTTAYIHQSQKLMLEGDFNQYFTLYVPKGYERDALYIFTPDLMALFIDNVSSYDAEIIGNQLYIYASDPFSLDTSVFQRLMTIRSIIATKLIHQTRNYADAAIADKAKDIIAPQGASIKQKSLSGRDIVIISIVGALALWGMVSAFIKTLS